MSTYAPPGVTIQEDKEVATVEVAEVMARILPTSTEIDADAVQMMERIVKDFASAISSIAVSLLASNVSHQHLGIQIISASNQMGFKDYCDPLAAYDSYIAVQVNNNNNNKKRLNNRNGDVTILEDNKRAKLSSYVYNRQVVKDKDQDISARLAEGSSSSSSSSSRLNPSFIPPPTVTAPAAARMQKTSSTGIATAATGVAERSNRNCFSEVKKRIVQDYLSWDPSVKYNAVIMAEKHNVTPAIVRRCIEPVKGCGPAKQYRKKGSLLAAHFTNHGGHTSTVAAAASRGIILSQPTATTSSSHILSKGGQASSSSSSIRVAPAPIQQATTNEGKVVRIEVEKSRGVGGLPLEHDGGQLEGTTHSSSSSSRNVSMSMSAKASIDRNEDTAVMIHHRTTLSGSMTEARYNIKSHDDRRVSIGGKSEDVNTEGDANTATVLSMHVQPSVVGGISLEENDQQISGETLNVKVKSQQIIDSRPDSNLLRQHHGDLIKGPDNSLLNHYHHPNGLDHYDRDRIHTTTSGDVADNKMRSTVVPLETTSKGHLLPAVSSSCQMDIDRDSRDTSAVLSYNSDSYVPVAETTRTLVDEIETTT